jgi:hypothetical protein
VRGLGGSEFPSRPHEYPLAAMALGFEPRMPVPLSRWGEVTSPDFGPHHNGLTASPQQGPHSHAGHALLKRPAGFESCPPVAFPRSGADQSLWPQRAPEPFYSLPVGLCRKSGTVMPSLVNRSTFGRPTSSCCNLSSQVSFAGKPQCRHPVFQTQCLQPSLVQWYACGCDFPPYVT